MIVVQRATLLILNVVSFVKNDDEEIAKVIQTIMSYKAASYIDLLMRIKKAMREKKSNSSLNFVMRYVWS